MNWTPITKGGKKVSNLFFANDLTLFFKVDTRNCQTIKTTHNSFSKHSSRKINTSKFKVIFSNSYNIGDRLTLSKLLNIQTRDYFEKYLGFPIFYNKPTNGDFQFILDNLNSKLACWKIKLFNLAGRTTIEKAYLSNIPNHVMQYISIPSKIQKLINKTQRNFI